MKGSARDLWRDYLFLTQEMGSALKREDVELFEEIMNQRERLQQMLDSVQDDEFRQSLERSELLRTINRENEEVSRELLSLSNRTRKKRDVDTAYGARTSRAVGKFMDRQG